jgi:GPN-loop GTPase
VDVISHNFCVEWMTDYDALSDAIAQDSSYMSSLNSSMAVVLEEFYQNLRAVGVSAHTGAGMDDFLTAVDEAVDEYNSEYKPLLEKLKEQKAAKQQAEQEAQWKALKKDMGPHGKVVIDGSKPQQIDLSDVVLPDGPDVSQAEAEEIAAFAGRQ